MSNLIDEEMNYSQLTDFDENDQLQDDLSLINSCDFDFTFNEKVNDPLKEYSEKISEDVTHFFTALPANKLKENYNVVKITGEKLYYDVIKPLCPNLENSYVELFSDDAKGPDFAKAFVAKRIAKAMQKANKSFSCSNLHNLDATSYKSSCVNGLSGNLGTSNLRRSFSCLNDSYNTDGITLKVGSESFVNHPPISSGSIEVLNYPQCRDEPFAQSKATDCTYGVNSQLTTFKLQKSLSFSGFSGLEKNESLLDIELKLEDSVPSEDERDEMGLPVKKIFVARTPSKKEPDLSQTLIKYKKILRASFGEPYQDRNDDDSHSEAEPLKDNNLDKVVEPPLISEIQDCDIQLKKTSNKVLTKGPMKALVPIQNMTKQMGVKVMSPFKKKKEKKIDISLKNASHIVDESFDERLPMAASTPTSDCRSSRSDSADSTVHSKRRSLSEGRTPVKKNVNLTYNTSLTKQLNHSDTELPINSTKIIKPANNTEESKTRDSSNIVNKGKESKKPVLSNLPATSNGGVKRPSTAPVKLPVTIKAPLTTKLFTGNQSALKQTRLSKLSTCIKPPSITKLNTANKLSVAPASLQSSRALKTANSNDIRRSIAQPTLRRANPSNIGKENK